MNIKSIANTCLLSAAIIASSYSVANAEDKSVASSENKYYTQINLGGSISNSTKANLQVNNTQYSGKGHVPAGLVGIEGGVKLNDNFRVGLALDYRPVYPFEIKTNNVKVGKLKASSMSAMAIAYYDFTSDSKFTPYVTLGAGAAKNSIKINAIDNGISTSKKTNSNFAYKLGLGTKYSISESFDFDVRYQFVNLGKYKLPDTATQYGTSYKVKNANSIKMQSHELLVGLAYKF